MKSRGEIIDEQYRARAAFKEFLKKMKEININEVTAFSISSQRGAIETFATDGVKMFEPGKEIFYKVGFTLERKK